MLQRVLHVIEHLQREDHFDDADHQKNLETLEREFHENNAGPQRNIHLSARPSEFYSCSKAPKMWIGSQDSRLAQEVPLQWDRARKEAEDFQSKYEKDVQFIFSHVQHHWHAFGSKW